MDASHHDSIHGRRDTAGRDVQGFVARARGNRCVTAASAVRLLTDAAVYSMNLPSHSAAVPYSVSNVSGDTVWAATCGEYVVAIAERREGGTWRAVTGAGCNTRVIGIPASIPPGGTIRSVASAVDPGMVRCRASLMFMGAIERLPWRAWILRGVLSTTTSWA